MLNILYSNKIEIIFNHTLHEILGTENPKSVTSAVLINTQNNKTTQVAVDGIFIAIGHKPNSDLFKETQLILDEEGYIITKPNSTATNLAGIYAAGDIQDKIYRQAVTAAGTGCMAALEVEKFLAH
jgi:thioredoxin reductase (NADPH)